MYRISDVIASLEIPECNCPLTCTHACDGECDPDAYCACCLGECECPPNPYQPPCRHMLAAEQHPAWREWLAEARAAVSRLEPPEGLDEDLVPLWREQVVTDTLIESLLLHDYREYRERPAPTTVITSVSWEARVNDLRDRINGRPWGLWNANDVLPAAVLRVVQVMHHGRNGAVKPGELQTEGTVQSA